MLNIAEYTSHLLILKQHSLKEIDEYESVKLYNVFKYFRDACTRSSEIQVELCNDELLPISVNVINKIFNSYDENLLPPLKQALQYVYNLTVQNNKNQLVVWDKCREYFKDWMKFDNESTRNYVCGILYNVILDQPHFAIALVVNTELLNYIIESALRGTDFPLLFVYNFWRTLDDGCEVLMVNLFKCNSSYHPQLLNMLYEFINENEVPLSCVLWITNRYKAAIGALDIDIETSLDDLQELFLLLKMIVLWSSNDIFNTVLQSDFLLLDTTRSLLEKIHFAGKNPTSVFSPTENIMPKRTAVENLKANLIRLIGNLCWHNKSVQDRFREYSGLPLILDCCIRDGKNPFITEIVIFTIRNLCEGNLENQNFIKNLNEETHNEMCDRIYNWPSVYVS